MTTKQNSGQDAIRQELDRLLGSYGGDHARWPAGSYARLATEIDRSPDLRRAVADARAFDRLLEEAPALDAGRRSKLADRIAVAALAEPRQAAAITVAQRTGNVVAFEPRRPAARAVVMTPSRWRGAALLAASLALGLMIGLSGSMQSLAQEIASQFTTETDTGLIAMHDDVLADEDVL